MESEFLQQKSRFDSFQAMYRYKFQGKEEEVAKNRDKINYPTNLNNYSQQFLQAYDQKFQINEENDEIISVYLILDKPNLKQQIYRLFRDPACCGKP